MHDLEKIKQKPEGLFVNTRKNHKMIEIEKIAKRLIPEENLNISHASPGTIPCWNCFLHGPKLDTIHGKELSKKVILLNKKDKIVNNTVHQYCVGSQSALYRYISRAKVTANTLNLKKWVISIEIHAQYYFTICLIKDL